MSIQDATKPTTVESRASKMIRDVFESGRPLAYVRSPEEMRVANVLREVAIHLPGDSTLPVWTWSLTEGMHDDAGQVEDGARDPRAALDFIAAHRDAAIFHLKDFHEPLRDSAEIRRRLRDVYQECLDQRKFIVVTSPVRAIPEELDRSLIYLELRPPDVVELAEFLRQQTHQLPSGDLG